MPTPIAIVHLSELSWQFRDATKKSSWHPAIVPGCVHRDLLRHGLIADPLWGRNETELQWIDDHQWEYRCRFTLEEHVRAHDFVELVCDGLDTIATVRVNGVVVGRGDNMFRRYHWSVKKFLKSGRNELHITFHSASSYIERTRRSHVHWECDWRTWIWNIWTHR
jgi:beta-mannosidase